MTPSAGSHSRCSTTTDAIRCSSGAWRSKSGIEHRYSCLAPSNLPEDNPSMPKASIRAAISPTLAARMRRFETTRAGAGASRGRSIATRSRARPHHASADNLLHRLLRARPRSRTHRAMQAASTVERTMIGFMGCYAAINALKLARHIVRSEPSARVLIVNLELCTLHLQETADLEQMLSFLLFGDGCRGVYRQCGSGRHRARQLPRRAGARHARTDHLEYPRLRLRHGVVREGSWPRSMTHCGNMG